MADDLATGVATEGQDAKQAPAVAAGNRRIRPWRVVMLVVLVLLIGAAAYAAPKLVGLRSNPLVKHFAANAPQMQEMMKLSLEQIEEQGASLTAAKLLESPFGYDGRFVVATGSVASDMSKMMAQDVAVESFNSDSQYSAYVLDDGLVVVDVSGDKSPAPVEGAQLKAYGKVIVAQMADIYALPWVGPDLKRSFDTPMMSTRVVFLIARGVKVMSLPQGDAKASEGRPASDPQPAPAGDSSAAPGSVSSATPGSAPGAASGAGTTPPAAANNSDKGAKGLAPDSAVAPTASEHRHNKYDRVA